MGSGMALIIARQAISFNVPRTSGILAPIFRAQYNRGIAVIDNRVGGTDMFDKYILCPCGLRSAAFPVDSVEQVRRQHEMFKRQIGDS